MEKTMTQGLYDQIANNEDGNIEDNVQLISARLYFYKLQKPYALEKGKERFDNVVIGDTHKNVMLVNDNDNCSVVLDGYIGKWEQSVEMKDRTFDTKEFKQDIKRQVLVDGDLEWLQDGTWIISFNEPYNKDSNFDEFWVFSALQKEYGWRNGEANFPIMVGDKEVADPYYNQIREDGGNVLYLMQNTQYNTLNGNALLVNWGTPIYLNEAEKQWTLKEIIVKGDWNNSAFHSIELQGMNSLYGKVMNSPLQVEKIPFLINPISLENITKFWSMWFSDKVLALGEVEEFIRNDSITGYDLDKLLLLDEKATGILWDSAKDGQAKIISGDIQLEVATGTFDYEIPHNTLQGNKMVSPYKVPTYTKKKFTLYSNNESEIVEFYSGRVNTGTFTWKWRSYPHDTRNNWSYLNHNETAYAWIYNLTPKFSNITIQDSKGNYHTFNNGMLWEFDLKINDQVMRIDFDKTLKEVSFGRLNATPMGKRNIYKFVDYLKTEDSPNNNMSLLIKGSFENKLQNIVIKGTSYADNNRLIKLLKKLIQFTWYYKRGFPSALFNDRGTPLNMSAKIKDKFSNSNYAPNQVITNIIEDYKMKFPNDMKTEQWRNFMAILPMLGDYILCDYCIDGGLNDQHKAMLPWYFELNSSLGSISKWTDSDNSEEFSFDIDNDGSIIIEDSVIENEKVPSSAWVKFDLDCRLRSQFFNLNRDKNTGQVSITNKFDTIDRQPNITVGALQRTYPTFDSEMAESDISTIPYNMNLSDDYLRYMFNLFIPKTLTLQDFIGIIGAGTKFNANFTKTDYFGLTTFFEDGTPPLSLKVVDNVVPTQFDLKGLFGNELEFEFVFTKEVDETFDGNIINKGNVGTKTEEEWLAMMIPNKTVFYGAIKNRIWNGTGFALTDGSGGRDYPLSEALTYVAQQENDNEISINGERSDTFKSFSFKSKIFNDNDDRICRTSFLI